MTVAGVGTGPSGRDAARVVLLMIAAEFPDALAVALTEDCPPGLAQARDHRDRRAGKAGA